MDILLPGPPRRIQGLDFDASGPTIDGTPLLAKSPQGFAPRSRDDLDLLLRKRVEASFDSKHVHERLAAIARSMNAGDLALAAIATSQLRLRTMPTIDFDVVGLRKAGADDPVRPGWPAGTPGGRGGKFRPKDAAIAFDTADQAERLARVERLKARRGVRASLRRILSAKRLIRLGFEGLGKFVPLLDALDTAALAEDIAEIAAGIAEENAEVDAATAFVEQGPRTLEELTMSGEEQSFPSFDAFQKIDLERRFGLAGDGYDYHHIVEQSSGLSAAELNSTSNIVRIPKLLHEEINADFARVDEMGASLRQRLQGASFEKRRAAGLAIMRKVGILYP